MQDGWSFRKEHCVFVIGVSDAGVPNSKLGLGSNDF